MSNLDEIRELLESQCIKSYCEFVEELDKDKANTLNTLLENEINNLCFHKEPLGDEIAKGYIAKRVFSEICEEWLGILNYQDKNILYDARNEYGVKFGTKMVDGGFVKPRDINYVSEDKDDFITSNVVCHFFKEHRYIQQCFTDLCVYFLSKYGRDGIRVDAAKILEEY